MNDSVLAVITDPALLEEVRRAAAAAGTPLSTAEPPVPRKLWTHAGVAVLDAAAAMQCAHLPRRSGVVVVAAGEPPLPAWRAATAVGACQALGLPAESTALAGALGQLPSNGTGGGHIVTVVGGRGGAGASTLAAAIAVAATEGRFRPHTLLVDGDAAGGGIDLLLGAEATAGLRWPGLSLEGGRVAASALHDALPTVRGALHVLACGRTGEPAPSAAAAESVLAAGADAGDLVVCDAGRGTGPAAGAMIEAASLVTLVVPANLRAVAAARPAAGALLERNTRVHLLVRGPSPGGLRAAEVAQALELPLLTAMRPQPGLAARLERGGLRLARHGPLRAGARAVLATLDASYRARRWQPRQRRWAGRREVQHTSGAPS